MELGERRPVGGKTGDAQEMHQAVTAQLDVVKPVAAPGVGGSGSGHGGNLSGASSEERTSTGCHKFPGFRQGFQQLWWQARCSTRVGGMQGSCSTLGLPNAQGLSMAVTHI
jgi:hypothetical protein